MSHPSSFKITLSKLSSSCSLQFTKRSISTSSLRLWLKKSSVVCARIDSDFGSSRVFGVVRCIEGLLMSVFLAPSHDSSRLSRPSCQLPLPYIDSWNRHPASAVSCMHDDPPSTAAVFLGPRRTPAAPPVEVEARRCGRRGRYPTEGGPEPPGTAAATVPQTPGAVRKRRVPKATKETERVRGIPSREGRSALVHARHVRG